MPIFQGAENLDIPASNPRERLLQKTNRVQMQLAARWAEVQGLEDELTAWTSWHDRYRQRFRDLFDAGKIDLKSLEHPSKEALDHLQASLEPPSH